MRLIGHVTIGLMTSALQSLILISKTRFTIRSAKNLLLDIIKDVKIDYGINNCKHKTIERSFTKTLNKVISYLTSNTKHIFT